MPDIQKTDITFTLHCSELPPVDWGECQQLRLGLQREDEVIEDVPTSVGEVTFTFPVRVQIKTATGEIDFGGPFVHGKKGDRFCYLNWGERGELGHWRPIGRVKVPLIRLERSQILSAVYQQKPLGFSLRLTSKKGGPAYATLPVEVMDPIQVESPQIPSTGDER